MLIDAEGGLVGVVWVERAEFAGYERDLHARVSTDGGASFSPDKIVGEYTPVHVVFLQDLNVYDARGSTPPIIGWPD